jgi:hypothetical protein
MFIEKLDIRKKESAVAGEIWITGKDRYAAPLELVFTNGLLFAINIPLRRSLI